MTANDANLQLILYICPFESFCNICGEEAQALRRVLTAIQEKKGKKEGKNEGSAGASPRPDRQVNSDPGTLRSLLTL